MELVRIALRRFRNHENSVLEPGGGINVLLGRNGQGKTNLLEAVSYLSLTKSFYAQADADVLQLGAASFELDGVVRNDAGREHAVRVVFERASGEKEYQVDRLRPERLAEVIGRFPAVILSPDHAAITTGGPSERRRFLDLLLAQVSSVYLDDMLEYRRALRQRNRLLLEARLRGVGAPPVLEPWTASVVQYGARVVDRRLRFIQEFREYVHRAHGALAPEGEEPAIAYASTCGYAAEADGQTAAAALRDALERSAAEERRRGMTLAGPHRDDVLWTLGGRSAQRYASQGQHKTLLVAIKVAEAFYLRERRDETPMVLLDDVFGELDRDRVDRILGLLGDLGQTIITATDEGVLHGAVRWNDRNRRFEVDRGTCRAVEAA